MLKTRSVGGEHKSGTRGPEPNQPDSRPDKDGLGQTVAARRNEQDALIGLLLNLIDGLLQDGGIIRDSVALHRKILLRQVNCFGIIQARGVVRAG